jgi:hypothetical protein
MDYSAIQQKEDSEEDSKEFSVDKKSNNKRLRRKQNKDE